MARDTIKNPTLVIENKQGRILYEEFTTFAMWKVRYMAWLKVNDIPHIVYLRIRSKISAYKIERCSCKVATFSYAAKDVCELCSERIDRKKYYR